jgi:hypothetical protein
MVFNATFNNISVISGRSVLLVEETGVTGENHRSDIQYGCYRADYFNKLSDKNEMRNPFPKPPIDYS